VVVAVVVCLVLVQWAIHQWANHLCHSTGVNNNNSSSNLSQ